MKMILKYPRKIYLDRLNFMINYENNHTKLNTLNNYLTINNFKYTYQYVLDYNKVKYISYVIRGNGLKISNINDNKMMAEYIMKDFLNNYNKYIIV